ncbi:uncharacterized protein V1510DRAFT_419903 [Dipodascopsis tothii]|uniref:uncharacterized protein n=1 Tax=Dipodascopsis tothii TaxID=44089 RepID=UPI0034CD5229
MDIANALLAPDQLAQPLDYATLYRAGKLVQAAGIILRLPQETIGTAAVLAQRFLVGTRARKGVTDACAAALFVATKAHEVQLASAEEQILGALRAAGGRTGVQHADVQRLYATELVLLAGVGFDLRVVLPYRVLLYYVRVLRLLEDDAAGRLQLVQRAWNYVSDAVVIGGALVHQPNVLAMVALWLATRELGIVVRDGERWWEPFDVDTEDMGHAVVLLRHGRRVAQKQ